MTLENDIAVWSSGVFKSYLKLTTAKTSQMQAQTKKK